MQALQPCTVVMQGTWAQDTALAVLGYVVSNPESYFLWGWPQQGRLRLANLGAGCSQIKHCVVAQELVNLCGKTASLQWCAFRFFGYAVLTEPWHH